MQLKTFDLAVDSTILRRGKDYWQRGLVSSLEEVAVNEFIAVVEGSDPYEVSIYLNEAEEITKQYCDCPYSGGPVCKHTVAVLFELRDLQEGTLDLPDRDTAELKRLLRAKSKAELLELLHDMAERRSDVKEMIFWLLER